MILRATVKREVTNRAMEKKWRRLAFKKPGTGVKVTHFRPGRVPSRQISHCIPLKRSVHRAAPLQSCQSHILCHSCNAESKAFAWATVSSEMLPCYRRERNMSRGSIMYITLEKSSRTKHLRTSRGDRYQGKWGELQREIINMRAGS